MTKNSNLIDRMKRNPLLTWLSDMIQISGKDEIKVPTGYRERVLETKQLLDSDTSGIVNTILDFAVEAALVEYSVETPNKNLTKLLTNWLGNINGKMRGEIPVGIKALAKEYFRERWKGSSFLLLRTLWEEQDGYKLPTTLYFLDGEDVVVKEKNEKVVSLNGKTYYLRIGDDEKDWKKLPASKDEKIFIQKPYTSWGKPYSTPYLIQRGIFRNLKFLELLERKGEFVVSKALEYLGILKKGTENMLLSNQPELRYSQDDLQIIKDDFSSFVQNRKNTGGISTYATNFDTELEHVIPEYSRALKAELFSPIERRILAGLGLVDIIQGLASTRRESTLNPKPFFGEVQAGIDDFKLFINDIMVTIVDENKKYHRKYFASDIIIGSTLVKESLTDDLLDHLRSAYDRGNISKRTYSELLGTNYDTELKRRKAELDNGDEDLMYPQLTQNQEATTTEDEFERKGKKPTKEKIEETTPEDKQGPEKKNYKEGKTYEEAPYKNIQELPSTVQVLPVGAKKIWLTVFNNSYSKGEDYARKVAWTAVKLKYKNIDGKWVIKNKGEIEEFASEMDLDEIIKIKKLEILGKQGKILNKLIKDKEE